MERPHVFLTGAARGIGRATAFEFARRGYDLSLFDVLEDELLETTRDVAAMGAGSHAYVGDLSDLKVAENAIRTAIDRCGRLDVLINNAAWRERTTMQRIELDSWEKTLRICLTAPAFLSRWAAEAMSRRRQGVIVNVSSINASQAPGMAPAYVAAKGGLESLTYELASLYGPMGIRVLAIQPGAVDTVMSNDMPSAAAESLNDELQQWSQDVIPLRRWAPPEEIARAIAMCASADASYMTGTTIVVDGGWLRSSLPYSLKQQMGM